MNNAPIMDYYLFIDELKQVITAINPRIALCSRALYDDATYRHQLHASSIDNNHKCTCRDIIHTPAQIGVANMFVVLFHDCREYTIVKCGDLPQLRELLHPDPWTRDESRLSGKMEWISYRRDMNLHTGDYNFIMLDDASTAFTAINDPDMQVRRHFGIYVK